MAIREILEVPDPRLKTVSTKVEPDEFNDELNERIAKPVHPVRRTNEAPLRQPEPQRSRSTDFVIAAVWLMIGVVVGAGLLLAISSYLGVSVG